MSRNIVIINDFAHVNGGAGQVALSSAVALAKRNFSVTLFSAVAPVMPELAGSNVKAICLGQQDILNDPKRVRAAIRGIWNADAARVFSSYLDTLDESNTVIHVHSWTKALSSSVVRAAIKKRFKVVCTLHDYFTACPNGGFFNFQENRICTLKALSTSCIVSNCDARSYPQKLWRVARQVVQRGIGSIPGGIRHYIYVSDFSRDILSEYLPAGSAMYHVPNPIEAERSAPVDVSRNSAYSVIARLSKEKGVLLFARAAKELGCDALFVGDGACREEIRKINPCAKITGWATRGEVNGYINQTRVLVLPSLLYEAQPLVVLEAAGRGVPAVVPDRCAAADMVDNGITGLLFRSGDLRDLVLKMQTLLDDKLVGALGKAAFDKYWKSSFTMARHLDNLTDVYERVLAGS